MIELLFPTFNSCLFCDNEDQFTEKYAICKQCIVDLPLCNDKDCLFYFDDKIKNLIYKFKYDNHRYIAKMFAKMICEKVNIDYFDYITYVPLYKNKKRIRGYNQSELICKYLDKNKTISLLERTRNTVSQTSLSREERKINMIDAFKLKKINISDKKILIIDDVFTTGSTIGECKRVLSLANAKEICCFCVAKAL